MGELRDTCCHSRVVFIAPLYSLRHGCAERLDIHISFLTVFSRSVKAGSCRPNPSTVPATVQWQRAWPSRPVLLQLTGRRRPCIRNAVTPARFALARLRLSVEAYCADVTITDDKRLFSSRRVVHVRLAGCLVPRFDRLRFRRVLLTQKDTEHDKECDR